MALRLMGTKNCLFTPRPKCDFCFSCFRLGAMLEFYFIKIGCIYLAHNHAIVVKSGILFG